MNANLNVSDLTRFRIIPESTAPEADALTFLFVILLGQYYFIRCSISCLQLTVTDKSKKPERKIKSGVMFWYISVVTASEGVMHWNSFP